MSKTGRYSAVQVRANPPGRAKLASKLASQSQPERASEDYTSHLSAATGESQNMIFFTKSSLDTNTHTHVCFCEKWGHPIGVMVFILYKLFVLLPYT